MVRLDLVLQRCSPTKGDGCIASRSGLDRAIERVDYNRGEACGHQFTTNLGGENSNLSGRATSEYAVGARYRRCPEASRRAASAERASHNLGELG
jgi:hypothetical protein